MNPASLKQLGMSELHPAVAECRVPALLAGQREMVLYKYHAGPYARRDDIEDSH
jgi:hypothetical protein